MSSDDIDLLISQLSASLSPSQYAAFLVAARAALADVPCLGPGVAYRVLADLQKLYFDPPPDRRASVGPYHYRASKLSNGPPIGADDPRCGGRDRRRLRLVGERWRIGAPAASSRIARPWRCIIWA
jgi:hypothetical protein